MTDPEQTLVETLEAIREHIEEMSRLEELVAQMLEAVADEGVAN